MQRIAQHSSNQINDPLSRYKRYKHTGTMGSHVIESMPFPDFCGPRNVIRSWRFHVYFPWLDFPYSWIARLLRIGRFDSPAWLWFEWSPVQCRPVNGSSKNFRQLGCLFKCLIELVANETSNYALPHSWDGNPPEISAKGQWCGRILHIMMSSWLQRMGT